MMMKPRPKHLALHQIRLPLPGFVSILHRVSGALLFLSLPFLLWLFQSSLRSIETYTSLRELAAAPLCKAILLVLAWALFHHVCAGIRYLALDMHWGVNLRQARASSRWVLGVSLALTILTGVWLW